MSRWIPLYATSPSGKTLFVCLMCGRISPTPDKVCAVPPVTPAWKMSASCAVLEEIEEATGGRDNSINERIMVSVLSDGSAVAQWKSSDKKPNRAAVEIVQHVSAAPIKSGPTGRHRFERTPDGYINNCALVNGDDEDDCQVCSGRCPDRNRF